MILVVQEIFGVHEHIKDVCRRFAKLGYLAIAPELFGRQGDVSKMTDIGEMLSKVVSKVLDEQVFSDLDATVAYVKTTGKANIKNWQLSDSVGVAAPFGCILHIIPM